MYEHSGPYWGLDKAVSLIKQLTTGVNKRNKYLQLCRRTFPLIQTLFLLDIDYFFDMEG